LPDDCTSKLVMLRFFLSIVNLLGAMSTSCLLLATYLSPVGIAIQVSGVLPGIAWWMPPLTPLGVLAAVSSWVVVSYAGLVPHKLTPWAVSSTTLWIGTCRFLNHMELGPVQLTRCCCVVIARQVLRRPRQHSWLSRWRPSQLCA
jgi:hypothetical protein